MIVHPNGNNYIILSINYICTQSLNKFIELIGTEKRVCMYVCMYVLFNYFRFLTVFNRMKILYAYMSTKVFRISL
jgi:hypothetical protein